jgi:hypothetical protein
MCGVRTYVDIKEVVIATAEIERVLENAVRFI